MVGRTPAATHHAQRDLTDAGEACLAPQPQQMLALMDDVEQETRSHGDVLRGQLRITCSMSLAYAQMAAAAADFLKQHPQLKIDLNASEGALNLVESRMDLAIRISAEPDPVLIGRVLAPCASVLVASPAYLAEQGRPQIPADLSGHRCLSLCELWQMRMAACRGRAANRCQRDQPFERQRGHRLAACRLGRRRHRAATHLPGPSAPAR